MVIGAPVGDPPISMVASLGSSPAVWKYVANPSANQIQGGGFGLGGGGIGSYGQFNSRDGFPPVELLRERFHDAIRDRVGEAVRERLATTVRQHIDDVLREWLGTAIRKALVEQRMLGRFDPDQFADEVRTLIGPAIREQLSDAFHERLHEVERDRLYDATRSEVAQHLPEMPGFGKPILQGLQRSGSP